MAWERGPEACQQFLLLLNHPEGYVRYFAAIYALRSNPDRAIPVLERLDREERGLLAFRAGQALNNGGSVLGAYLDACPVKIPVPRSVATKDLSCPASTPSNQGLPGAGELTGAPEPSLRV
jgi:hypothetical protein